MAETLYRYGIKITPKGNHSLQVRKPKMEIGTVMTDWSPAPEDPDNELYERLSVLQTDFSVVQGEIQAKVWETDIEKATDGLYEQMDEIYSYINETVDSIVAEVGDLVYTVNGNLETLTAQVANLTITNASIATRVSNIEQELGAGVNLLIGTDDMSIAIPWDLYNSENERISSWQVYESSGIPAGSYYATAQSKTSSTYTMTSTGTRYTAGAFHWWKNDDVIYDNFSHLIEGNSYTLSFYLRGSSYEYCIWVNNCVYGQTVLSSNYTIYNDGPDNENFGRDYIVIPTASTDTWSRVTITFRMDNLSEFRFGICVGGIGSRTSTSISFCGLMLNSGENAADWDDGEGTEIFATKNLLYSEIDQLADSITATVASVQTDVNGQISEVYSQLEMLSDSITAIVADVEKDVSSQIKQLAGSISLTVSSQTNGSASIIMTVDGQSVGSGSILSSGVREAFKNDTSAIIISAGTITFNSNTFIVNSTYFSVTADGQITATKGIIGGWTIATNGLYSGPTSVSDTTTGIYMGPSGFRSNGDGIGIAIKDGAINFYDNDEVVGYIKASKSSWGGTHRLLITASDDNTSGRENTLELGGPSCIFQVFDWSGLTGSGNYVGTYTGTIDTSQHYTIRVINGLIVQ